MRIEPVKFSAGPFLVGCEPLRVIAMGFGSFDGALALERLATIALVEFETQGAVDVLAPFFQ